LRVLIINQCFFPDVAATAQHAWDLARHLRAHGHSVTAIASRSLYGAKGAQLASHEVADGIEIRRVGASRFGKGSLLGRIVDFAQFYLLAAWHALRMPRQDVVVCLTTPPFIVLVGLLLRALRGTRVVYWVMDLYPDVAIGCGVLDRGSLASRALEAIHRGCLRNSDRIVVLGRCMQDLVRRKGATPGALRVIGVWADPEEVRGRSGPSNPFRARWAPTGEVLVMYSGNFGIGHDFETLADALAGLDLGPRMRLAFVGGGKRKAEFLEMLRSRGVHEFADAPHQPRELLGDLICAADVHLVTLRRGIEGIMVPSKFYGAMCAGKPVIYVGAGSGEIARALKESGAGFAVEPGDVAALRDALRTAVTDAKRREDMARRAEEYSQIAGNSREMLRRWETLLSELDPRGAQRRQGMT
jgi:colanic acid biosynthesis glycosyl transferase WcaI